MLRCVDVSWATLNVAGKIVSQLNCKAITSLYESVFPMGVSKRSGSHSDYTDTHSILFWLKHASSIIIHHHWLRSCFDQSYRHVKWRSFSFHWFSQVKIYCYCMLLSQNSRIEQFAPKFWGFLYKHLDERFLAARVCPFFEGSASHNSTAVTALQMICWGLQCFTLVWLIWFWGGLSSALMFRFRNRIKQLWLDIFYGFCWKRCLGLTPRSFQTSGHFPAGQEVEVSTSICFMLSLAALTNSAYFHQIPLRAFTTGWYMPLLEVN